MVLSYDSYKETLEKQKQKEERLELIERQVSLLMESQKDMHISKIIKIKKYGRTRFFYI